MANKNFPKQQKFQKPQAKTQTGQQGGKQPNQKASGNAQPQKPQQGPGCNCC